MISSIGCFLGLLLIAADPKDEIQIDSAQLTLIEHANVSASEPGVLSLLAVKEGETVEEGRPLAKIDDRDVKMIHARAEVELQFARVLAENDIKTRFAKLAVDVANSELARAKESNAKFPKSVSQTELDRLKLMADKAVLEVEQAVLDRQQAQMTLAIKQQDLNRAALALERRTIAAPFPGMVVEWKKQHGEWVEPGTPIMRLIRLNRLRAEAFITLRNSPQKLVGRGVTFLIDGETKTPQKFAGKLVYVSPEIDPVNGQVRIWAEIENNDLNLRPGQSGRLQIGPMATEPTATGK